MLAGHSKKKKGVREKMGGCFSRLLYSMVVIGVGEGGEVFFSFIRRAISLERGKKRGGSRCL